MSDLSICEAVYEVRGFGCPDGAIRCEQPGPHDMHVNWTHCRTGHTWFDAKPSTREQIRATAIERLAKATHWRVEYMCLPGDPPKDHWETASEGARERCRDYVTHLVDALGDLLPTGVEQCEALVTRAPVRKYTHDWIEVSE